jgi:hypothetical protein
MDEKNETTQEEVLNFFRALVNVDRLKIAGLLGMEALSNEELSQRLGLRPADTYNHLSCLVHFNIVKTDGKVYRLDTHALEALSRRVLANSHPKPSPEDFEGEAFDRRVLSDFLTTDGRIKALPMQNKKLTVILRHILPNFEPGMKYPEKQVNELLRRYFDDPASLRRYLVDYGMLKRENGIYWKA